MRLPWKIIAHSYTDSITNNFFTYSVLSPCYYVITCITTAPGSSSTTQPIPPSQQSTNSQTTTSASPSQIFTPPSQSPNVNMERQVGSSNDITEGGGDSDSNEGVITAVVIVASLLIIGAGITVVVVVLVVCLRKRDRSFSSCCKSGQDGVFHSIGKLLTSYMSALCYVAPALSVKNFECGINVLNISMCMHTHPPLSMDISTKHYVKLKSYRFLAQTEFIESVYTCSTLHLQTISSIVLAQDEFQLTMESSKIVHMISPEITTIALCMISPKVSLPPPSLAAQTIPILHHTLRL